MHDLIDIYVRGTGGRWAYLEGTRMHKTLASAVRHYRDTYGLTVKAKWSD